MDSSLIATAQTEASLRSATLLTLDVSQSQYIETARCCSCQLWSQRNQDSRAMRIIYDRFHTWVPAPPPVLLIGLVAMRQLTYTMHFRGQASHSAENGKVLRMT